MTSLSRSGGSGDGGGGSSGSSGGRTSSRCGAVRWGVARCSFSGVRASPFHPGSYVSGTLVGVVAAAVVAAARGASRSSARCSYVIRTGDRAGRTCGTVGHTQSSCFSCLSDTWRAEFGDAAELPRWLELLRQGVDIFALDYDAILTAMYALTIGPEGDCSLCVLLDPGIEAAAQGASESALPGTAPAEALHTITLDSGASSCLFRDSTTLTPLSAPVPVRLADPSGGPLLARSSTVLPCPAVLYGSLSSLHLLSFSTNLVSTAALQDAMVTTTTPGGQRVLICTCTRTDRHLATFTRRPGSSLYTLAIKPPQVAASAQVPTSGQVAPPCSCRLLSHQTLLWHHCLGHPSLPRLNGMHSRLLVSGLPRSLPPLPPLPAPPCLPCVEGRHCDAPHSSSFPPTTAPLQTLHMDVGGPARVNGQGCEHHYLLVVDEYTRYTTVFPLRSKVEVPNVLIPWIRTVHLQLRELCRQDLPVLCLHSDRGAQPRPHCVGWGRLAMCRCSNSGTVPAEVAVDSGVARGSSSWGAASRGAETGGAEPGGAEPGGAESEGAGSGGAEPGVAEPGGAEPAGVESKGAEPAGVEPGGAESMGSQPRGTASSRGLVGALPQLSPRPEPLSSQQLREWFTQCARLRSGATGAGDSAPGDTGAGGAGVTAGAGCTRCAAAAGHGGAGTRGTGAAGTGSVGGAGAGGTSVGGAGARGAGAGGAKAGGVGAGGARAGGAGAVDPRARGAGAGGTSGTGAGGTVRSRPYFVPLLQHVLGVPSSTGLTPPLHCPPPDQSQPPLQPTSPQPAPSSYTEQTGGIIEHREPASRPAPPVCTGRHSSLPAVPDPESDLARAANPTVSRLLAPVVTDPSFESSAASALVAELVEFAAACYLDYATALVAEFESSSPPSVGGECALGMDVLEDRQEDFDCLAAAVPRFASMLLAPEGDLDAPDILTPRSYAEAITGTLWSLRRPVYGLCQVPHEWHDTLRTTLAALVFTPSTTDPSLFLHTDTSLPSFYVLVLQRFGFQFSSPQPNPLSTGHSLSAPPSDESVEPSGPYPELVGCLITSGMGLVLGGRGPVVLTSYADASWVDDSTTQRSSQGYNFSLGSGSVSWRSTHSSSVLSSSCEVEIYEGAMAA
ncbi:unnamed protein product [Closterium sp. NIES-53]